MSASCPNLRGIRSWHPIVGFEWAKRKGPRLKNCGEYSPLGVPTGTARARRTKLDWALAVAQLLDTRYATVEDVTLVCDNLNTHTKGAFYEAFEPERARAYPKRLKFCYTPKHGSWLNVAECELSCLTRQCERRIGALTVLQTEIAAWSDETNAKPRGVDGQFRLENARVKLKRLYRKIKT
jgi:hypothetical protein